VLHIFSPAEKSTWRCVTKNIRDSRIMVDEKSIWFRAELNFCPKIVAGRQGCIPKKEVWNAVPTPNIKENRFACKNFHTGSSCFTLVLRCYTRDNLSFIHLCCSRCYTYNWNEKSKSSSNVTIVQKGVRTLLPRASTPLHPCWQVCC